MYRSESCRSLFGCGLLVLAGQVAVSSCYIYTCSKTNNTSTVVDVLIQVGIRKLAVKESARLGRRLPSRLSLKVFTKLVISC